MLSVFNAEYALNRSNTQRLITRIIEQF